MGLIKFLGVFLVIGLLIGGFNSFLLMILCILLMS